MSGILEPPVHRLGNVRGNMTESTNREEGSRPFCRINAFEILASFTVQRLDALDDFIKLGNCGGLRCNERKSIQRRVKTCFDVLHDVINAERVVGVWNDSSESEIYSLFAITQGDESFPIVLDVECLLHEVEEPRPGFHIFTLGDPKSSREDLAIAIQDRHDENDTAIRGLHVASVKTNYSCRVGERVDAHPKSKESALKHSIDGSQTCFGLFVGLGENFQNAANVPKRDISQNMDFLA